MNCTEPSTTLDNLPTLVQYYSPATARLLKTAVGRFVRVGINESGARMDIAMPKARPRILSTQAEAVGSTFWSVNG